MACVLIVLPGCYSATPPDPARLEYKTGDVYKVKKPLFIEDLDDSFVGFFISKPKPALSLTEARERDGQPEQYLKNPNHKSYRDIRGIVVPGSRLRVSRIGATYYGLGESDWKVFANLLQPPFEGREVSLYLVSGDYDRVGHLSSGCIDRKLLELISTSTEPEQAAPR